MEETPIRLFITTVGSGEAASALARGLVERGVAACVNTVPGVRSFFVWKGETQEETEVLLLIKTSSEVDHVAEVLRSLHPYELPEIVALDPGFVEPRFARWVRGDRDSAD